MAEINKVTSPLTVMSAYPWQSICTPLLSYLILKAPLSTSDGFGGFIICVGLFALAFARYKETQEVAESTLHEKLEEVPGTASNASSSSSTSAAAAAAASSGGSSTSNVAAETSSPGKGNVVEAVEDIHVRVNNTTNGEKESSTSDDPWAVRKETSTT
jgi:hypothetical protein